MNIAALYNKLLKSGYEAKKVNLWSNDGKERFGIMVKHDYCGPYPTKEALETHVAVANIARHAGFDAEKRGYYTATLIYYGG